MAISSASIPVILEAAEKQPTNWAAGLIDWYSWSLFSRSTRSIKPSLFSAMRTTCRKHLKFPDVSNRNWMGNSDFQGIQKWFIHTLGTFENNSKKRFWWKITIPTYLTVLLQIFWHVIKYYKFTIYPFEIAPSRNRIVWQRLDQQYYHMAWNMLFSKRLPRHWLIKNYSWQGCSSIFINKYYTGV